MFVIGKVVRDQKYFWVQEKEWTKERANARRFASLSVATTCMNSIYDTNRLNVQEYRPFSQSQLKRLHAIKREILNRKTLDIEAIEFLKISA